MHISTKYKGLAAEIIKDGEVLEQNLLQNRLSFAWLYNQLHSRGINTVDDVFYASLNTDGSLYIDLKDTTPKIYAKNRRLDSTKKNMALGHVLANTFHEGCCYPQPPPPRLVNLKNRKTITIKIRYFICCSPRLPNNKG